MTALLLAAVVVLSGEEVPPEVGGWAKTVVERSLEGVEGEIRVRLFPTAEAMRDAVRAARIRSPEDFAAHFDDASRTIFAWTAPRLDLCRLGLLGLLEGALRHEAEHARGLLTDRRYRLRPAWRIEGEADRAAATGSRAWRWLLQSRAWRAKEAGLLLPWKEFYAIDPGSLDPRGRATWYAQAWLAVQGEAAPEEPEWLLLEGFADLGGEFTLMSEAGKEALILSRDLAALDVDVEPLFPCEMALVHQNGDRREKLMLGGAGGGRLVVEGGKVSWRGEPIGVIPPGPGHLGFWLRDGACRIFLPAGAGNREGR